MKMDLSKKIIISFATNAGWLGKTFQKIKELCPKSKIEQEISIVFTEEIIPYPINYNECCDIAKIGLNENKHSELVKYLNNIEEYKTIYIGGPVWWGHLPIPLQTQLEKLDFSGKIVKLFTTHEGSGLGNCEDDIKKLCKNANIGKSIAICGSKAKESKSRLEEWVKE